MPQTGASELILNANQRLYHLNVEENDIADKVILVGDPARVSKISRHFSKIEIQRSHREFVTHTGIYKTERMTVMSTGIGTDNIDIVLNELDAVVNMDLHKRKEKDHKRQLNLLRLGTSGALQEDLPLNSLLCSAYGLGLDGLLHFYQAASEVDVKELSEAFVKKTTWPGQLPKPYSVSASTVLLEHMKKSVPLSGITATAPGFYGPQGRQIRLASIPSDLQQRLSDFEFKANKITNFEMETSALYGLGALLGHRCLTVCVIIANRIRREFTTNLEESEQILIDTCLEQLKNTL